MQLTKAQSNHRRRKVKRSRSRRTLHKRCLKAGFAICVLKGLVLLLLVSCYLYKQLTTQTLMSTATTDTDTVHACVRRDDEQNQCSLPYPCQQSLENGDWEEIIERPSLFGYAGRFTHRVGNNTKPLPETLGDTGWASGCLLSDEYKFVFIHVLKSGGTGVKKFIKDSLCGLDAEIENIDGSYSQKCTNMPATLIRAEGCKKSIRDHQDYFHFSFVRNPFSRMYSAYSMMDGFPPKNGVKGRLSTKDFSFSEFVVNPYERSIHTSMWPGHYDQQYPFLFSEKEMCPMFDFIGRLEHFDEDMRRILTHLNATKMQDYMNSLPGGSISSANSWGSRKKQSNGGLRKQYSTPQVIGRVASDYIHDFRLLGYDIENVPEK